MFVHMCACVCVCVLLPDKLIAPWPMEIQSNSLETSSQLAHNNRQRYCPLLTQPPPPHWIHFKLPPFVSHCVPTRGTYIHTWAPYLYLRVKVCAHLLKMRLHNMWQELRGGDTSGSWFTVFRVNTHTYACKTQIHKDTDACQHNNLFSLKKGDLLKPSVNTSNPNARARTQAVHTSTSMSKSTRIHTQRYLQKMGLAVATDNPVCLVVVFFKGRFTFNKLWSWNPILSFLSPFFMEARNHFPVPHSAREHVNTLEKVLLRTCVSVIMLQRKA